MPWPALVVPALRESDPLMKAHSKIAVAAAAGAMLLASAAPASARGYDGRWGRYSHHHRGHDNTGAVIGAILGVGLIAAIASSAAKQREAQRYPARRPGEPGYDPRYDDRARDYDAPYYGDDSGGYDGRYSERDDGDDRYDEGGYGADMADHALANEDAAINSCAIAARDEASRNGGFAEVRDITGARPFGSGWDVTGTLSQRPSFRAGEGRLRSFRCIWDNGRVEGVTFG